MSEKIYYICKYTPVELLAGLGLEAVRLDPAPDSFSCADACLHPNLCGYGKAVAEAVEEQKIRRLIVVNCCDVCQRIYDVLLQKGEMELLFLLNLPHKASDSEIHLFRKELSRLCTYLESTLGRTLDVSLARKSWEALMSEQGETDFVFGSPTAEATKSSSGNIASDSKTGLEETGFVEKKGMAGQKIILTGAHGGSFLRSLIEEKSPLPIEDQTCTGMRKLSGLPDCLSTEDESEAVFLKSYAEALLTQEYPCMRMQFRKEQGRLILSSAVQQPKQQNRDPETLSQPAKLHFGRRHRKPENESASDVAGIICHTMKFCDYYGFSYRHLRKEEVPLLKIETDSSPQSLGQLHTRLDAFFETILMRGAGKKEKESRGIGKPASEETAGGIFVAGLDSGSASTDVVVMDEQKQIVGKAILPTGAGAAAGAQKALELALNDAHIPRDRLSHIVSTGYGRETVGTVERSVTEITCHAKGAYFLCPEVRTVIDIGGQDSKVIRLDAEGNVTNFVMNDKCAAGTGRFLEMMARTLGLDLAEMSGLGLTYGNETAISSMCTVFAESEVVSLIADNTPTADIIRGLNMAVAKKTASLARRLGFEEKVVMTGGVARNQGVVKALEKRLGVPVTVPEHAQLCGAIGAALYALESVTEGVSGLM